MTTEERISFLVKELGLLPHPEGGFYSETFRAGEILKTQNGDRNLMTSIYFLLRSEDVSHFHRIQSDELWFWHEGSSLTIHLLTEKGHEKRYLGPSSSVSKPQQLVQAKTIFGSTVDDPNQYALVSCVVAPGFDFRDFELFSYEDLISSFPKEALIIRKLT